MNDYQGHELDESNLAPQFTEFYGGDRLVDRRPVGRAGDDQAGAAHAGGGARRDDAGQRLEGLGDSSFTRRAGHSRNRDRDELLRFAALGLSDCHGTEQPCCFVVDRLAFAGVSLMAHR